MMPYEAAHVANFFLDRADQEGRGIDPMKLQKLVYIGYGWVLATLGRQLFDEPIEAWRHGPVIPSLFHEFKRFRSAPITVRAGVMNWENVEYIEPSIPDDDQDVRSVLGMVWDIYKRFSGWDLRNKTHEADTPWSETYAPGVRSKAIDPDRIKEHFARKIDGYLDAMASPVAT
ncbi:MAG: SocA family protein [Rhodospirillales bacterium]|nr:SocA family protein [Rhodospirillales bacterium]